MMRYYGNHCHCTVLVLALVIFIKREGMEDHSVNIIVILNGIDVALSRIK